MNLFPRPAKVVSEQQAAAAAVSVIVTLYDSARFVEDCLDSIAKQTQTGIELIVVDDCSPDDGLMRVLRWIDNNARHFVGYRIVAHLERMGLAYTRNTAFSLSTAARVFVMDAANTLYPRAVERCMQAMDASGSAGAYTQLEYFGERSGLGNATFWDRELFKPRNYLDATALVAREAWKKVGGYTQLCADGAEDYDFWCKFVESGLNCTFVPEILCRYRVQATPVPHPEAATNTAALVLELSVRHPWLDLTHFRQPT